MGWFSADIQTMNDLFLHTLQDIYYAEQQIAKNLPTMIQKAVLSPSPGTPTARSAKVSLL